MQLMASPAGITGPQLTPRKWVISVSMSFIVRCFTGGVASGCSGFIASIGHKLQALLHNAQALAHLFHTYHGAVVAIAIVCNGYIEVEFLIARIGLHLAEVPLHTAGTETRTGNTPTRWLLLL